jgi:hypothetical protein
MSYSDSEWKLELHNYFQQSGFESSTNPSIVKELKTQMLILNRTSGFVRRGITLSAALSAVLGAGVAVMNAQTSETITAAGTQPATSAAGVFAPALNLKFVSDDPIADAMSSSSSENGSSDVATVNADPLHLNAMQYGGRQRYGQPRYRGGNTNADGSNKYTFEAGAGFTLPVGNTYHYLNPSYSFQVGGGRQFNKKVALLLQFDWDNFGFNGRTLAGQQYIYNTYINLYNQTLAGASNQISPLTSIDGSSHIWSFSLNPTYTIYSGEGLGAYVVVGVGFYHKVATFTTPGVSEYCDPYYGCYQYEANQVIDHYTSNAPGFNGGFGITYKFSRFSNERLFGEIRYVFVDNSQRSGVTPATVSAANANETNDYPANSNRTTYLPVKFGIRF